MTKHIEDVQGCVNRDVAVGLNYIKVCSPLLINSESDVFYTLYHIYVTYTGCECHRTNSVGLQVSEGKEVKVWVLVVALLTILEQQRLTISQGAADWYELMIPWRIMRPSIARDGEQLDPRCSTQTYHRPNQRTMPSHRRP